MQKYTVTGMTCSACQAHVEKAVSSVNGVDKVEVSLLTNSMQVEGSASEEVIIAAVESAGYGARLADSDSSSEDGLSQQKSETQLLIIRLVKSLIFLLILMYITMGHHMFGWWIPAIMHHNFLVMSLVQMVLCVIILFINRKFFISGLKSLFHGSPNMDTLVAMGSGVSFLWSVFVMLRGEGDLYFESAAMIPTLITVGKTLESYSKGRTTDALKSLMKLSPKIATVQRDGQSITVSVDEVEVDDIVCVKPGESFPVDGVIIEGNTTVDESALTGESMPVDKTIGDSVSTATINKNGFVKISVTHVGGDTAFAKIVKMVSDASSSKAPIARIADVVSGFFVPAVIVIAIITTAGWLIAGSELALALERGIAVLVVSCPCALGLATPVAIMVGNGVGARRGILFKNGEALENCGRINIVALDKTGTITEGSPKVTDIYAVGVGDEELLQVASSLEKKSEHPLAKAVVDEANRRALVTDEVDGVEALPGNGLRGLYNGQEILAGSYKFISSKVEISQETKTKIDEFTAGGKTPMLFAKNGVLIGVIATSDVIREDSREAINNLLKMGIKVVMITGDNDKTARAIGSQAGISEVISEVLPDGKSDAIKQLQSNGRVAMVGDGINDAPALTVADTGIAIGAGTDVAIDSANVVLMNSRLSDVVTAIRLSRATLRNIHENLFWAFAYNVLLIPMAAGLYPWFKISPMWGAAAMALSSFCVCMNALRLNLFESKKTKHKEEIKMEKTIVIEGMMCPMCEKHTREALSAIAGVEVKSVSHAANNAVVVVGDGVSDEALMAAVNGAGYKAIEVK